MKRCPECDELYEDQARFCEADGCELLVDPTPIVKPEVGAVAPAARSVWPAVSIGVVIGVIVGAGVFAVAFLFARPESNDPAEVRAAAEVHEKALPQRPVTAHSAATPEPEVSPSPDAEPEDQGEPSPAPNTETRTAPVQLNQGPISTGEKTTSADGDSTAQTVIEMNDGSTLDVEAAWEDKQGIWYRRSGLVSFVESSRVKAITSRREAKSTEVPHH
jgi:hypothetical protein